MNKLIPVLLIFFIFSCTGSNRNEDKKFQDVANEFIVAFDNKDLTSIEKYIDPKSGFFVIDNPGAFIIVEYFTSFNQIAMLDSEYGIGYLNHMRTGCRQFVDGSVPVYSCDEERWNTTGCFTGKSNSPGLSRLFLNLLQFELLDQFGYDNQITRAREIDSQITHFIYSTDASVGFYFGKIDGNWRLLCIDKVVPCSA